MKLKKKTLKRLSFGTRNGSHGTKIFVTRFLFYRKSQSQDQIGFFLCAKLAVNWKNIKINKLTSCKIETILRSLSVLLV